MTYRIIEFVLFVLFFFLGWSSRGMIISWYIEHYFDSDEESSLNSRRVFYVWLRSVRIAFQNKRYAFKEWFHAWRKGLVRLSPGSVVVTDVLFDAEEMMCGEVPCELFSPLMIGTRQYFPNKEVRSAAVHLHNRSKFDVEVHLAFRGRRPDLDNYSAVYMVSAVVNVKAECHDVASFTNPFAFVPNQLIIGLPKYVTRP